MKKNYLTKEGLEKLKKELEYLKTTKRKEIAQLLRHAASFGDLSENFAYHDAKEQQNFLEHRITELTETIKSAVLVEKKKNNRVQIGSTVVISRKEGKKTIEEKYQIVGSAEANPLEGKISSDSPLGKAMINLKAGYSFNFETSEEKTKYKIIRIE